jgi:hypothetical protein
MLSIDLWRWYINVTITILDIIHHSVFYLKRNVSETRFCLRLHMEPTQMSSIYRASLSPFRRLNSVCVFTWNLLRYAQQIEVVPVSVLETEFCFRLHVKPTPMGSIDRASLCLHLQVEPTQMSPIDRASPCLCDTSLWFGSESAREHMKELGVDVR